jgi:Ferritin-like domain
MLVPACLLTPPDPTAKSSLAACAPWCADAEKALNDQIAVEQNLGHIYDSMAAYFDRDNVALPGACWSFPPPSSPPAGSSHSRDGACMSGLTKFFAEEADSERSHARKIIEYMNERGGVVKLGHIEAPPNSDVFASTPAKGDALCAMELALALEKVRSDDRDSLRSRTLTSLLHLSMHAAQLRQAARPRSGR